MIISFLGLSIISLVILGFSSILKNLISINKDKIRDFDFILGILFISFISILANFFIELNKISYFIIFFGIILFFYSFYKKKIEIKLKYFFFILFLFCFFTHDNGLNYDSPFYHLQIIKWSNEHVIPFGLINLEQRYAMPSVWHTFLSTFSFSIYKFNPVYLISLIPFSFLLNQSLSEKNFKKLSSLFLIIYNIFLLGFSLIHPFEDGIIFNHLGSPESDIIGIVFFGFSFYFFLRIIENNNIIDFYYLLIFVFFGILTKISYIYLLFLLFSSIWFLKYKIFENNKLIIFLIFMTLIWFARNLIISGCLIFPISITCFEFPWSNNIELVEYFFKEAKSWSRATRDRAQAGNFAYTLESFKWFLPWFKDYFLNTSILKILSVSFLFLILSYIYNFIFKTKIVLYFDFNIKNSLIILFLIFGFFIWMQSPEVRYGHGLIISIIVLNSILVIKLIDIEKFINTIFLKTLAIIILVFICVKNYDVTKKFKNTFTRNFDYTHFTLINTVNGFDIFSPPAGALAISDYHKFCGDFSGICGYQNHPTGIQDDLTISLTKFGNYYFKRIKK